jgi:hypothetical protein
MGVVMIFSDPRYTRIWLQMVDAFLTCAAMLLAYWIRVHLLPGLLPLESNSIGNFSIYIPYAVILALLTPIVLARRECTVTCPYASGTSWLR